MTSVTPQAFLSRPSHIPFDEQFRQYITQFIEHIISQVDFSRFKNIILIDDGGEFLSLCMILLKGYKNTIGIEQTTSGYGKVKSIHPNFPIINVARCDAKLTYETPMIIETIIQKAFEKISGLARAPKKTLIIGNGVIGSSLHATLKNTRDVQVYDKKFSTSEFDAPHVSLPRLLEAADLGPETK